MLHCTHENTFSYRPFFYDHMTSHDQTTKMDDSIQDIGFEASFSSSTDDCESEYIVYLFEGDEK